MKLRSYRPIRARPGGIVLRHRSRWYSSVLQILKRSGSSECLGNTNALHFRDSNTLDGFVCASFCRAATKPSMFAEHFHLPLRANPCCCLPGNEHLSSERKPTGCSRVRRKRENCRCVRLQCSKRKSSRRPEQPSSETGLVGIPFDTPTRRCCGS